MPSVTEAVWHHPPVADSYDTSLLNRMGGVEVLTDYVYGLYDNMLKDKEIGPMLVAWMQTAPHDMYMKHLKDRTVDYLECVWAADPWTGQDLFVAHAHLHISPAAFDRCIKCGSAKLKSMNLPSDIKKEILKEMEVMKEPITDGDGKFDRWVKKKNAELEAKSKADGAVDISGMGFSVPLARIKEMEEKKRKDEARQQALAALKEKRKQEELQKASPKSAASPKEEQQKTEAVKKVKPERSKAKTAAKTKAKTQSKAAPVTPPEEQSDSAAKVQVKDEAADLAPELPPELPPLPEDGELGFIPDARPTELLSRVSLGMDLRKKSMAYLTMT